MNGCCPGDFGQDDPDSTPAPAPDSGGGFFDFLFPSSSTPESSGSSTASSEIPPLVAAPQGFDPGDPSQMMSKYFTLSQMIPTSLPYPNLPEDQASFNNLKQLASMLDAIQDTVGPFTIASCYRSPANQAALSSGAQGASSAAMASHAKKSYHTQGLAADITPANGMSTTEFARACFNSPEVSALMGQLVDKSEGGQSSCHVSVQTSQFPKCTPMYVGPDGQYYRMDAGQIQAWQNSASAQATDIDSSVPVSLDQGDEDDEGDVTQPPWILIGVGVAAALGAGYWFYRKRKA